MEKKGVAVTASLVFVALLSGILLGGTVARPPPVTITSQTTVEKTVTVAETTVEVPVKHQPAPYSALAYTACIYDKTLPDEDRECEKNTKAVYIEINFRELGTENSYLRLDRVTVIAPGLVGNVAAEGMPLDAKGRVVVMPRNSASISVTTPVNDLFSFTNWMHDIGRITVIVHYEDQQGGEVGTISIEGINIYERAWTFPRNQTEAGPRG
jgi:hypothetical protein